MKSSTKGAESSAQHTDAAPCINITKFKCLLAQVASTWVLTLCMAVAHLALCVLLVPTKCESGIVFFNARCAGMLLVYGCLQSLSVTLVTPLKVLHALLHHNVEAVKQDSDALSVAVAFGNVLSGIALLIMPLYGFYVCLGTMSCKEHAPSHYIATVILSSIDSFITCGAFWSLVRGRDCSAIRPLRRRDHRKRTQDASPQTVTKKAS